jgi:hypothetical protein|tara:strand:- start:304 stop:543 length:240 start_codon:yes stop_codon:yes gene_type:complete
VDVGTQKPEVVFETPAACPASTNGVCVAFSLLKRISEEGLDVVSVVDLARAIGNIECHVEKRPHECHAHDVLMSTLLQA